MQKMIWFLGGVGMLFFAGAAAFSQGIVIDTNDVKAIYAVGNILTFHDDAQTVSMAIGGPGATAWDFEGLTTTSLRYLQSVPVGSTAYADSFPGARFALLDTAFSVSFVQPPYGLVTLDGSGYTYYGLEGGLLNSGFEGAGLVYLGTGGYTNAQGHWLNTPASKEFALPIQYTTTWTSSFTETMAGAAWTGFGWLPFPPVTTTHSIAYSVDAYGPCQFPTGMVRDAIRIRKVDTYAKGAEGGVRVGYIVMAKNGGTVQWTMSDINATSGTVDVSNVRWWPGLDIPVPIELSEFAAERLVGGIVALKWTTISETDNFGFFIQRRGAGEKDFADLSGSFVAGHGTTIVPQQYSFRDGSAPAEECWYRLKQLDLDGTLHFSDPVRVGGAGKVPDPLPASHELAQNFPNPCNPTTTIRYGLPERGHVQLTVYNAIGQQVALLQNGEVERGYHEVNFNASGLASGVYIYRLTVGVPGSFSQNRKMLVLR